MKIHPLSIHRLPAGGRDRQSHFTPEATTRRQRTQ